MSLVVFEQVSLGFGAKPIVEDLSLRIGGGDRVGLVGPNGSGKTSLLRMLADQQTPDGGVIRRSGGVTVGYLPQDLDVREGRPLLEFVVNSVPGRPALIEQISTCETELARAAAQGDQQLQLELATRLSKLHEDHSHFEMHFTEHHAQQILAGLGFPADQHQRPLSELSGGWKMRSVLAGLLFQNPDLLLLDEPTNHLDMPSVAWFGQFLQRFRGAFVLVCHDREFLNEQIGRTLSFEPEGLLAYAGNYDAYQEHRAIQATVRINAARNLADKREKAEQFIRRFRAKASKASAVQSKVKMLEKLGEAELFETRRTMKFSFAPCKRAGRDVLLARDLCQRYGSETILESVQVTVARGDRIGITGVNGAGKTTLLKMLAGELEPSAGEVVVGHNVDIGYYAQHHAEQLTDGRTIFEEVYQTGEENDITRVRTLLGAFLFSGDEVDKLIRVLSGGERARVALAKLLATPGNVLLMDEPTNHLDLDSSEALADALASYDGTLVFVSHNRGFVRKLATSIWEIEDRAVRTYPGTLDEYLDRFREPEASGAPLGAQAHTPAPEAPRKTAAQVRARKREEAERRNQRSRRIGPLKKRAGRLESQVTELEREQAARAAELEDPKVYSNDEVRFALLAKLQTAADEIEQLTARWTAVQEELEQLESDATDRC